MCCIVWVERLISMEMEIITSSKIYMGVEVQYWSEFTYILSLQNNVHDHSV